MSRNRPSSVRSRLAVLALLILLAATSLLWAAEPAIKVSVVAILASDRDNKVDPELPRASPRKCRRSIRS